MQTADAQIATGLAGLKAHLSAQNVSGPEPNDYVPIQNYHSLLLGKSLHMGGCDGRRAHPERNRARIGRRHSMPSSNIESCEPDNATVPCVAYGHTNRPRSSLFAKRHSPSPLHQRILTRSPARPAALPRGKVECIRSSRDGSGPRSVSVSAHVCRGRFPRAKVRNNATHR
jgi:hypothetical protein